MKIKYILFFLSIISLSISFSSCSDNDDEEEINSGFLPSKIKNSGATEEIMTYDNLNRIIKIETKAADPSGIDNSFYNYPNVNYTYVGEENRLASTYIYYTDKNGNQTSKMPETSIYSYAKDTIFIKNYLKEEISSLDTLIINSNGRVQKSTGKYSVGGGYKATYEYDAKGNILRDNIHMTIIQEDNTEETIFESTYKYDDKKEYFSSVNKPSWHFYGKRNVNNITEISIYSYKIINGVKDTDKGQISTQQYEYKYNADGYPVEMLINGKTRQTIEYIKAK